MSELRGLRPLVLLAVPLLAGLLLLYLRPQPASAHPLGNFTVNRYSRIELYSNAVRVRYVLDMAEIPAFAELDAIDANGDGNRAGDETEAYLDKKAADIMSNLTLSVDGRSHDLRVISRRAAFPPGQGGLQTLRIELLLESATAPIAGELNYSDENYAERIGWKEILVSPETGAVFEGTPPPTDDLSHELSSYPQDLLSSPPQVTRLIATFDASHAGPAPALSKLAQPAVPESAPERPGNAFAGLIGASELTLPLLLLSLAAAFGFGALHALEPGHGKTFVAAYFIGTKGTARQAVLLGLIVAVTHTLGVFAIGLLTLFGSQFILPERLYPWLSLASALMLLLLGVRLLAGRAGFRRPNGAGETANVSHHHGIAGRGSHQHDADSAAPGGSPWKSLVALGLADGLTPSPSALVVLLAAVSLHRIAPGILLIVAFSLGLSAVLTAVSLALVFARQFISRLSVHRTPWSTRLRAAGTGRLQQLLPRMMPLGAAAALIALGLALTARALLQPGLPIF